MQVSAWGRLADVCARSLAKGSAAMVKGFLRQGKWQDSQGRQRESMVLVAEDVRFLDGFREQAGQAGLADERDIPGYPGGNGGNGGGTTPF